jgi:hypothetical protein
MTPEHGRHEAKKRAVLEFFRREGKDPFAGRIEDISQSLSINDVRLSVNDIRMALERLRNDGVLTWSEDRDGINLHLLVDDE